MVSVDLLSLSVIIKVLITLVYTQ